MGGLSGEWEELRVELPGKGVEMPSLNCQGEYGVAAGVSQEGETLARKERRWPGRRDAGQEGETLARKKRRWSGRRDAGQEEETLVRKKRRW
ncbi:hypothetical protein EMCRGX_G023680 [Ephydatia muelleri]